MTMTTITEDYVSFEIAKLLKEKGFKINTDLDYWKVGEDGTKYFVCSIGAYTSDPSNPYAFYIPENSYPCPTQAMAMKWLREVYHIFIQIELYSKYNDYCFELFQNTHRLILEKHETYNNFEEACDAAIKYCLEKLI